MLGHCPRAKALEKENFGLACAKRVLGDCAHRQWQGCSSALHSFGALLKGSAHNHMDESCSADGAGCDGPCSVLTQGGCAGELSCYTFSSMSYAAQDHQKQQAASIQQLLPDGMFALHASMALMRTIEDYEDALYAIIPGCIATQEQHGNEHT